jgi:hypothetical protein
MSDEFLIKNTREWETAIKEAFPKAIPETAKFKQLDEIVRVLKPFCKANLNHTMLPSTGGMDMIDVKNSREMGCIEFWPTMRSAYLGKPTALIWEYFPSSPLNSFLLLETEKLAPSGVYENLTRSDEEVVELPDGEYVERGVWDQGVIGHDENDNEIPLPKSARLIARFFQGKFLVVAKKSIWNSVSATYDGRHNKLTAEQIREQIETVLKKHF